jgi:glucoamylase
LHWGVARTPAALALVVVAVVAVALVSGGSAADPRTPPALPGSPPPFLTVAALGDGGLTAGIDAYGDVIDLRRRPGGRALIDNPQERQAAGTVPADTGIVPLAAVAGGPPLPLWRADAVRQSYLAGTDVLRTRASFGGVPVAVECAASGSELGCVSRGPAAVSFRRNLLGGEALVHLNDERARRVVANEIAAARRWLGRARPLGRGAPGWARRMYARSLLAMRSLTDRRSGAVAAGARDGWAYVWPRDAGAVAIAFAGAGYAQKARHAARFLLGLDLGAAARFDGSGEPVDGRPAQGDAAGWVAAAARAAAIPARVAPHDWRDHADYQEKSTGDYLSNAISAAEWPLLRPYDAKGAKSPARREWRRFVTRRGLVREAGGSELDTAAAWAVRPFPHPALFAAARRTLLALVVSQTARFGPGATRFGIVPSQSWQEPDPWSAPTAWSAWSLAALGGRRQALGLLADLRRSATPAGLLPERVDARTGVPRSTAPLAWSHAFAVLALRELWQPGRGEKPQREP